MTNRHVVASQMNIVRCHCCDALYSRDGDFPEDNRCRRCRSQLRPRTGFSIGASWAWLLTATVLYFPANLLPMMVTRSAFGDSYDTIMSGVVYFWTTGSYDLACIIFTASIGVPVFKLFSLALLALSVQLGWGVGARWRIALYRVVEFIGRWSMLDVFVVTIMVGLVRFQGLATIEAGPAAAAFAGVVIFSMLSARSFDPRLIWDKVGEDDDE